MNGDGERTTLAVLAGGAGRRMGTPKAELLIGGRPILERLLHRLAWPGPTLLITAPGRERPPGWQSFDREAVDAVADEGPLRGLLTAVEQTTTDVLIIIPVDMPNITREPLLWLAADLRERSGASIVMTERVEGDAIKIEPFPAAVRRSDATLNLLRSQLNAGRRALHGLVGRERVTTVRAPRECSTDFWLNLNTPADLAAVSRK